MIEDGSGYTPPEIAENEGKSIETEDPKEKEEEIIIEKKYDGGDIKAFIIDILKEAHEKGCSLTIMEIIKQIKEASGKEKEEGEGKEKAFSFNNMPCKSNDLIIPEGITITIKIKPPEEQPTKKEEEKVEEVDDDDDDEDFIRNRPKKEEAKKVKKEEKEEDFLTTELIKVRAVLDTEEGRRLDQALEEIKRIGLRLVEKLRSLGKKPAGEIIEEPEEVITDRLELFRFLENAQSDGDVLTRKLKAEYGLTPHKELVPTGYVLSYLHGIYKEQGVEIPDKLLERTNLPANTPNSLREAVDVERLK
jgi:hypothetical protein